jgi:hypothetical protein
VGDQFCQEARRHRDVFDAPVFAQNASAGNIAEVG